MSAAPQKPKRERSRKQVVIAIIALIFAVAWAIIGILSILNIIQTNWSGISSVIFGLIGAVVAIVQYFFPLHTPDPTRGRAELELVDVSVVEESSNGDQSKSVEQGMSSTPLKRAPHVKLDFKINNVGALVVFLKRAEFSILEIAPFLRKLDLPLPPHTVLVPVQKSYVGVPVSENYDISFLDVVLNPTEGTRNVTCPLSQKIAPNDADRFTFTIGYKEGFDDLLTWYLLKVKLIFNETDDFIETNDILLCLPPIRDDQVDWKEIFSYPLNQEPAKKLLQKGTIKSPSVELVRQYLAKTE